MQNESNVKYLNIGDIISKNKIQKSYYFNNQYISSKLFYSSVIEYLMGKVIYKEYIIDVVTKILFPQALPQLSEEKVEENS